MQILKCRVEVENSKKQRAVRVLRDHFNCEFSEAEGMIDGFDLEHDWRICTTDFLKSALVDVGAELIILTPEDEIDTYEKRLSEAQEWLERQPNREKVEEYISLLSSGPQA